MAVNPDAKVEGCAGLYRMTSGGYRCRFEYKDQFGARHEKHTKLKATTKPAAKAELAALKERYDRGGRALPPPRMTVRELLWDRWFPTLDRRIAAGRFKAGTKDKYRRDLENHVVLIDQMQVMEVDGAVADECLTTWFTEGRVAGAGMGFPKTHSPAVVAMVCRLREEDPIIFTYDAIATLLRARFPEEKERGCTRHTVAGILKRERDRTPVPVFDPRLKEGTVGSIQAMLREAWDWAIERNVPPLAESNPWATAEGVIEREPKQAKVTWTVEQLNRFFDWMQGRGCRYLPLWYMAVATAERESGVLGLHWVDVDLAAATVTWNWYVKQNQETNGLRIEPFGKNDSGRKIPIAPSTVAMLGAHFATVAKERLAHGHVHTCTTMDFECPLPGYHDRGLVFPTPNGNYTSGKNMLRQFQVNTKRYNKAHPDEAPLPRVTIHSLRTLWNSVGAEEKVPQVPSHGDRRPLHSALQRRLHPVARRRRR